MKYQNQGRRKGSTSGTLIQIFVLLKRAHSVRYQVKPEHDNDFVFIFQINK